MHSKEREDSGECCQIEDQKRAEALTYEQSFVTSERAVSSLPEQRRNDE